jgi:S1-C subfamily serine protease/HEAT repeat protein
MNVKVQCKCGKGVKVSEAALGKPLKCPQCGISSTYTEKDILKRYTVEAAPKPEPAVPAPRPQALGALRNPPKGTAARAVKPAAKVMDPKTRILLFGGSTGGVLALVLLAVFLMFRSPTPPPAKASSTPSETEKTTKAVPPSASTAASPAKPRLGDLLEQMRRSVVWIAAERGVLRSSGTGFVVRSDGIILTNSHVINEARRIRVGWENGTGLDPLDAELIMNFPDEDLALLRVGRDKLTAVSMARESPDRGIDVVALGFPLSDAFGQEAMSVTRGIVTGGGHLSMNGKEYPDIVRTDALVSPGNSGGPLVDAERGLVIGVVFMKGTATGAASGNGFAIPTSRVASLIPELLGNALAFERRLEAESRVRADSPEWRKELERTRPYFTDLTSPSAEIRRSIPVDTLIKALQDADATVRSFAARALEERGAEASAAKDALSRALLDSNPGVRVDAATALAAVSPKDPKVLEILLAVFKSDSSSRREAAAIALGRLGNKDARVLQALADGLRSDDKTVFQASLRSLDLLKPEGHQTALPIVIGRLDKALAGGDPLSPLALVDALAICGAQDTRQVAPVLLRILRSRKTSLDLACTRALSELGPAAMPYLTDLLVEKDPVLRSIGVSTIGSLRPIEEKAIEVLGSMAGDQNPGVRGAVLSALAGALREGALVPLAKILRFAEDPAGDVRASCAAVLGTLSSLPPEGGKALVRALEDADPSVRRAALDSLRTNVFTAVNFMDQIVAKLADNDTSVRRLAADTLGMIGPAAKAALPRLIEMAGDSAEDRGVRQAAYTAGLRIAKTKNPER